MTREDYCNRNINQWTKTPCGTSKINAKEGTSDFFENVRAYRYEEYAPWLLEFINSRDVKGKKLLEIGCGVGTDGVEFAKKGAFYYGVDLTQKHVVLAKRAFKLNHLESNLQVMDATNLNFDDNFFDIVYSHGVLHHIPDISSPLKEIYRVLKTGGNAYLMIYHKASLAYYAKVLGYHGILRGKLLNRKVNSILSEVIEENSKESRPHVDVYTITEFKKRLISSGFKLDRIYTKHLMNEQRMQKLKKIFPERSLKSLENHFGWYIVAEVSK